MEDASRDVVVRLLAHVRSRGENAFFDDEKAFRYVDQYILSRQAVPSDDRFRTTSRGWWKTYWKTEAYTSGSSLCKDGTTLCEPRRNLIYTVLDIPVGKTLRIRAEPYVISRGTKMTSGRSSMEVVAERKTSSSMFASAPTASTCCGIRGRTRRWT